MYVCTGGKRQTCTFEAETTDTYSLLHDWIRTKLAQPPPGAPANGGFVRQYQPQTAARAAQPKAPKQAKQQAMQETEPKPEPKPKQGNASAVRGVRDGAYEPERTETETETETGPGAVPVPMPVQGNVPTVRGVRVSPGGGLPPAPAAGGCDH